MLTRKNEKTYVNPKTPRVRDRVRVRVRVRARVRARTNVSVRSWDRTR